MAEDSKYLFNELSGRLVPFYDLYPNLKNLIDQCDEMSLKLNPLLPIGQTFNSPSWILRDNLPIKMKTNETTDIEILENEFNGRILMAKNHKSTMTKFVDLDQLEEICQVNVGEGKCYCSKNGDFFCLIENTSKLRIKRIQTGDFYTHGLIEFGQNEIGRVFMSNKYAALTFRKSSTPVLIDLSSCQIIQVFPYSTNFCAFSADDKVFLIHSEKFLNYFLLKGINNVERKFSLNSLEIPELVVFTNKNRHIFSLFKDTKQIIYYSLNLEKNFFNTEYIIQDRDIFDMRATQDEAKLIVCSLNCIYVLDISTEDIRVLHKLKANNLEILNMENKSFNGFGCTLDNKIVFGTIYSYLICYDITTGSVIRVFQSSLAANRILKSCSSRSSDLMLSLLDDGCVILWNLACLKTDSMKFTDMRLHSNEVVKCLLPENASNTSLALSYSNASPDVKVHSLANKLSVKSIVKESYNEQVDDPLKTSVKFCCMNDSGEYCFILTEVNEFKGKQASEKDFSKRNCTLIDLSNQNKLVSSFSYIVKNDSRFEIDARFVRHPITNVLFLLFKLTSCINDFDPYCSKDLDWSEFETSVKLYGPISSSLSKVDLFDEFKLNGECLSEYCLLSTNNKLYFACLMEECSKLFDKKRPNVCLAKRYEVRLNIYNLFESKMNALPVEQITLNEFLTNEQFYYKNVMLDIRAIHSGLLLVIYSKQGAVLNQLCSDSSLISRFDYDYERYRFIRDICTEKAGLLFDLTTNKVLKSFASVFTQTTNVETLLLSKCGFYLLENNWHLYDLSKNNIRLMRKIVLSEIDLSFKMTQLVLNGEYLLTCNSDHSKIFMIRCNDSLEVASFRLDHDFVTCLSLGELDRTITLGTQSGCILPFRFLIDFEFNEAITKFRRVYRSVQHSSRLNQTALNEDVKKVRHSAHAHLQLKSKEANRFFNSRSDVRSNTSMSGNFENAFNSINNNSMIHNGIQKTNMANLTNGIKYMNTRNTTRACIIQ